MNKLLAKNHVSLNSDGFLLMFINYANIADWLFLFRFVGLLLFFFLLLSLISFHFFLIWYFSYFVNFLTALNLYLWCFLSDNPLRRFVNLSVFILNVFFFKFVLIMFLFMIEQSSIYFICVACFFFNSYHFSFRIYFSSSSSSSFSYFIEIRTYLLLLLFDLLKNVIFCSTGLICFFF